jgi:hypothetical protein
VGKVGGSYWHESLPAVMFQPHVKGKTMKMVKKTQTNSDSRVSGKRVMNRESTKEF